MIAIHSTSASRVLATLRVSRAVLLLSSFLSLAACNAAPKPPDVKGTPDQYAVAQDLARFDAGVRIAAANKRIDEAERQVGELQFTPDKIDLELLTNRVTALEVQATSATLQARVAPQKGAPKAVPAALRTMSDDPQQSEYARQRAKRTPTLNP